MGKRDIENFVEADGRAEMVKEVRARIDALGIEYLYLQFVSITGRICGKGTGQGQADQQQKIMAQIKAGGGKRTLYEEHAEYLVHIDKAITLFAPVRTFPPDVYFFTWRPWYWEKSNGTISVIVWLLFETTTQQMV